MNVSESFKLNKKINPLHVRCLRVTSKDQKTSSEELLEINNSVSVNYKNLLFLVIELYKLFNWISVDVTKNVFTSYTFVF